MNKHITAFVAAHVVTFLFCILTWIAYLSNPKGFTYVPVLIVTMIMILCLDIWGRCIDDETKRKKERDL